MTEVNEEKNEGMVNRKRETVREEGRNKEEDVKEENGY